MNKGRLEAFSDGMIAIFITIMVLEFKVPHEPESTALLPFLSYVLSFVFFGIYWSNHHHLLFWLSLIPFVTAWMGENHFAARPVALYGVALLGSAISYTILTVVLVNLNGGIRCWPRQWDMISKARYR